LENDTVEFLEKFKMPVEINPPKSRTTIKMMGTIFFIYLYLFSVNLPFPH